MFFFDCFKLCSRPSKEKPCVLLCRAIIIFVSFIILSALFVALIIKTIDEKPNVVVSYSEEEGPLTAPDVYFTFDKSFRLTCSYNRVQFCPVELYGQKDLNSNRGNDLAYLLSNGTKFNSTSEFVDFDISITDPKYIATNQTSSMRVILFDSYSGDIKFLQLNNMTNTYYLTQSNGLNVYVIRFSRRIIQKLEDSFLSRIGFNSRYTNYSYIETDIQYVPYVTSIGYYARLEISPLSLLVRIEKEQRSRTITDIIGTVSAIYGLISAIYLFLFHKQLSERTEGFITKCFCLGGDSGKN